MFARFKSAVVLSAVASLAITGVAANPVDNACNQGTISCCNTVQSPTTVRQEGVEGINKVLSGLLGGVVDGLLGGVLDSLDLESLLALAAKNDGNIGIGCSAGAEECVQQAVCCSQTEFNGLINVGCNTVNL